MRILLAEDDAELRESFARQLTRMGHEVQHFFDGKELCDALREGSKADLVWSDLNMPNADGFEVMQVSRTFLPRVPIVIVSGHADSMHILRALQGGATAFLPKPFEQSELDGILRRAESLRDAERNAERAWSSVTSCKLMLQVPPDFGVAASVVALLRDHARGAMGDTECHGLYLALHEILLNSIEHGCLEITREEKLEALGHRRYAQLVAERRADPRYASRVVDLRFAAGKATGIEVVLTDPGPGFDPTVLPDPTDTENLFLPSGRGIILAGLHVDELSFTDDGRTARLVVRNRST